MVLTFDAVDTVSIYSSSRTSAQQMWTLDLTGVCISLTALFTTPEMIRDSEKATVLAGQSRNTEYEVVSFPEESLISLRPLLLIWFQVL